MYVYVCVCIGLAMYVYVWEGKGEVGGREREEARERIGSMIERERYTCVRTEISSLKPSILVGLTRKNHTSIQSRIVSEMKRPATRESCNYTLEGVVYLSIC